MKRGNEGGQAEGGEKLTDGQKAKQKEEFCELKGQQLFQDKLDSIFNL